MLAGFTYLTQGRQSQISHLAWNIKSPTCQVCLYSEVHEGLLLWMEEPHGTVSQNPKPEHLPPIQ